jgi:predicted DNA binding CopG/RHH family protein
MKKKVKYDKEELELVQAWEAGALKPVSDMAQRLKDHRGIAEASYHRGIAEASFKKDQRLNIRISSRDLKSLQARALEEGIPYQTFAASLLHKFVNGHLVNQR